MPLKHDLPALLLRADADITRGTGHIMRCLALAYAWQERGGRAVFLSCCDSPALRGRVRATGAGLIRLDDGGGIAALQTTRQYLSRFQSTVLVLDGYDIDAEQQHALRAACGLLLVIDDTAHLPRYHADLLLNQNLGAGKLTYQCDSDTVLLFGPGYALLRPEFRFWRRRLRVVPGVAGKILVTMGGSDAANFTLKVVQALRGLDPSGLEARIVIGPANPHASILRDAVNALAMPAQLLTDVSDMASLMAWADVAVSAGGSTCWELACLGLPALIVVLAENQKQIAEELHAAGAVENAGWHEDLSFEGLTRALDSIIRSSLRRLRMSHEGKAMVDGGGADRVIEALLKEACVRAA